MRREKIAGSIANIQSMSAHGGQPFNTAWPAPQGRARHIDPQRRRSAAQIPHSVSNGLIIGWMSAQARTASRRPIRRDGWLRGCQGKPFESI